MADEEYAPQGAAAAAAAGTGGGESIVPAVFADASSSSSPSFTLDRINDIIDFESEIIMLDRANRNAHYETLRFFWQLHPARNVKTGRRYARFLIAQLLTTACNCEPYSSSSSSSSHKKMPAASTEVNRQQQQQQQQQQQPLDQWSRQDWQRLQDDLQHLREVLIRQDAGRNCDDAMMEQQQQQQHAAEGEDALEAAEAAAIAAAIATATTRLDVKRAQSPAFSTKYDTITILLETQKALAPIRCQLEEHLLYSKNDGNNNNNNNNNNANQEEEMSTIEESVISPEEMQDLFGYATSLTETRVSDLLLQLFEPVAAAAVAEMDESAEQQRQPVLQSNRQELKELLTTKAFDLAYLQEKLQTVLLRFNGEVYGKDVPVLLKLHYTLQDHNMGRAAPLSTSTRRRIMDRRGKKASQELYKFILATEQKPRARFTAIRSSTIKKKPPAAAAAAAPTTSRQAKQTKKKKNKELDDELKKGGGQAVKQEPTTPAGGAATSGGGTTRDDLVFGTPASTTTAPTPATDDDAKKGASNSSSKKRSRHQSDVLDLFDLDDKDDAIEAAKMSQGVKKSRVANSGGGGGGGGRGGASSAALAPGVSAAAAYDDDPFNWDLPPPDDGIFDQMGKVLRRNKWTEEEKNAVKEGVRTIGVGKWMDVKKKFPFVLKNRTSVQIKDCYRTMSKNKEMETEGV